MKILFVLDEFPSISQTFILNQIVGLIDAGHDVTIFSQKKIGTDKKHDQIIKYRLVEKTIYGESLPNSLIKKYLKGLRLFGRNFGRNPKALLKSINVFENGKKALSLRLMYASIPLLEATSYDIIHAHFGTSGLIACLLKKIKVITGPLITTFHGADLNWYPNLYGRDMYKSLFEQGDQYTANTNFTLSKAVELGCPKDRISVLPVGLDTKQYQFQERQLLPGQSIKILTVGRLVEKKGIEYSIRAVHKLLENHLNVEYNIIGEGPLKPELGKLINELGIGSRVKLLGSMTQEEVRNFYVNSHIFVLSSVTASNGDKEGQGLVLQEAQCMGMPVVSTIHNGIPDGILEGQSGFLVPEKDVDSLAGKLTYLVENPAIWTQMGKAGHEFVKRKYDIKKLTLDLLHIYDGAIEKFSIKDKILSDKNDEN